MERIMIENVKSWRDVERIQNEYVSMRYRVFRRVDRVPGIIEILIEPEFGTVSMMGVDNKKGVI